MYCRRISENETPKYGGYEGQLVLIVWQSRHNSTSTLFEAITYRLHSVQDSCCLALSRSDQSVSSTSILLTSRVPSEKRSSSIQHQPTFLHAPPDNMSQDLSCRKLVLTCRSYLISDIKHVSIAALELNEEASLQQLRHIIACLHAIRAASSFIMRTQVCKL